MADIDKLDCRSDFRRFGSLGDQKAQACLFGRPLTLKPFLDAESANVRRLRRAQRQDVGCEVANFLARKMNIERSPSRKRIFATQG